MLICSADFEINKNWSIKQKNKNYLQTSGYTVEIMWTLSVHVWTTMSKKDPFYCPGVENVTTEKDHRIENCVTLPRHSNIFLPVYKKLWL